MDIADFLDLSTGQWLSQRTRYDLHQQQPLDRSRSALIIEPVADPELEIHQFCDGRSPLSAHGLRMTYRIANATWSGNSAAQATLLVLWSNPQAVNPTGDRKDQPFCRQDAQGTLAGQYQFGSDQVLTLWAETKSLSIQERLWFVTTNLRLRMRIVHEAGLGRWAAFYSDIRKITG